MCTLDNDKRINPDKIASTPTLTVEDFKKSINPNEYNTKLSKEDEKEFEKWFMDSKHNGTIHPMDSGYDYDFRGYWKNEVQNNSKLAGGSASSHFTDKYKKPNHATFSNESMYATGNNAKYAGYWKGENFIKPTNDNNERKKRK